MARQTIERRIGGFLMGSLGLIMIATAIVIMIVRAYPLQVAALAVSVIACVCWMRRRSARRLQLERALAERCADRQMERHRRSLISCFRQSIRPTAFGGEDTILWQRHIAAFLDSQVVPELSSASVRRSAGLDAHLGAYVDDWVRRANAGDATDDPEINPARCTALDYEGYCASLLSRGGWTVQSTPVTGDRGADVVADKEGRRLVVQCKLYGQPVGNKAVQEVYSARSLYDGDHACVVAPRGFTAQAERDAHALGIALLHHSDLRAFANELSGAAAPPLNFAAGR